jgi:membrane protease YdiL (CAAX protease family)
VPRTSDSNLSDPRHTNGVILFAAAFLTTWAAWATILAHHPLPPQLWPLRLVARVALVILPTLLYVRFALRERPVDYLRLNTHINRGVLFGLVASLLPLAELIWRSLKANSPPQLPHSLDTWFNVILAAPISEETLFRGLLFREFSRATRPILGAVYSSILFAALHFPYWYLSHAKIGADLVRSLFMIFAIGLLCCFLTSKSRSLIAPLLFHFLNNLSSSCTF